MKKTIILIVAVFLHLNVYSNTDSTCVDNVDTNEELIEKISKSDEGKRLAKLAYSVSLLRQNAVVASSSGIEIENSEKELYTKVVNLSNESLQKIVNENPELQSMDIVQKEKVIIEAIQKTASLTEIADSFGDCFLAAGAFTGACGNINNLSRALFGTCVVISVIGDMTIAVESGGAIVFVLPNILPAQASICGNIAFTTSVATCVIGFSATVVVCVLDLLN